METITVKKGASGWDATFSDPQIVKLFGTDTVPTGFTKGAAVKDVLSQLRESNPNCLIIEA